MLAEVETSKANIEIHAPAAGFRGAGVSEGRRGACLGGDRLYRRAEAQQGRRAREGEKKTARRDAVSAGARARGP